MSSLKYITLKQVYQFWNNERRCVYCGHRIKRLTEMKQYKNNHFFSVNNISHTNRFYMATIDHIIPLSKGGKEKLKNLAPCCHYCNNLKANMTPNEFIKTYPELFPNGFYICKRDRKIKKHLLYK